MSNKVEIFYSDQFSTWHHLQTKYNQADAYRVAARRAQSTGKRHKITDEHGNLLDLISP